MLYEPREASPVFRIDVTSDALDEPADGAAGGNGSAALLRQIVAGQERTNRLLEELVQHAGAAQRQRAAELGQWKEANPELASLCRRAAEALSQVQTEFLQHLATDVADTADDLVDADFVLNEFLDRYGPRLAHLNGVLQVLSQLSATPAPANAAQ